MPLVAPELETLRIHNMGSVVERTAWFKYRALNFGVEVTLGKDAIVLAEWAADRRNALAGTNRRKLKYGFKEDGDRIGAYAELAVAALTGHMWHAVLDKLNARRCKDPDVGETLQVRASDHNRYLLVHPDDPDNAPFVKAITQPPSPVVIVYGWMLGREAKAIGKWTNFGTDHHKCFAVPHDQLHDLCDLPEVGNEWFRCMPRGYMAEIESIQNAPPLIGLMG